jgi:hypothetical protein
MSDKNIDEILRDGALVDRAARRAVREAVRRHKLLGNPVAIWRGGQVVWVQPAEIEIGEDEKSE